MASAEDKIRALIDRALGTDSEEEARTSALLAIKLAAKSGAVIRVRKREEKKDEPSSAKHEASVECEEESQIPQPKPGGRKPVTSSRAGDFVTVFASKPGACKHCGKRWEAGEVISQRPGERRAYHSGCAASRR